MPTKTIRIDEDRISGKWCPERDCFEFYIFGEDSDPLEKGDLLMRITSKQMHTIKGLKRDMKYIQKRLDEIDDRAHTIVKKIIPTLSKESVEELGKPTQEANKALENLGVELHETGGRI